MINSWTFFWLVGGEVIGSQHHQPSGSNRSRVYVFVGSIQLTSSTWWDFQHLQNSSKEMAQNIIYSSWGRTKGPWLCLMTKALLFCLAWLFFFLHFLTSLIKFIRWLKFFCRQKAGGGHGGWSVLGRPPRVLLGYSTYCGLFKGMLKVRDLSPDWPWHLCQMSTCVCVCVQKIFLIPWIVLVTPLSVFPQLCECSPRWLYCIVIMCSHCCHQTDCERFKVRMLSYVFDTWHAIASQCILAEEVSELMNLINKWTASSLNGS